MAEILQFLGNIFQPSMLLYTLLLCVVVLYWLIMILGFVGLDVLDFDLGLDGIDGAEGIGAVDGIDGLDGVEGLGGADGAAEGLDSAGDAAEGAAGPLVALLGVMNVGKVPVTIIASFLVLFMWILAYLYNICLSPSLQGWLSWMPGLILFCLSFVLIFIAGSFLTSLTTRPMRKLFEHRPTHSQYHLIGKICKVKTSKVTTTFGQAELKVDDSHLLISVRCPEENTFAKGEEAVIRDYDQKKDVYEIGRH